MSYFLQVSANLWICKLFSVLQLSEGVETFRTDFTHMLTCYCLVQVLVSGFAALEQAVNYWLSLLENSYSNQLVNVFHQLVKVI